MAAIAADAPRAWPIAFTVERGKCMEMARALRATDAAYLTGSLLAAVPTYPVVMNHWGTSGSSVLASLGCELKRVLHGSESFEYPSGPLREGMRVEGELKLVSTERKLTRSGRGMTLMNFVAELRDAKTGALAVRVSRGLVELDAVDDSR